jgi:hypothetical protein
MKNPEICGFLITIFCIVGFTCGQPNTNSSNDSPPEELLLTDTTYTAHCVDTIKRVDTIIADYNVMFSVIESDEKIFKHGVDWEGTKLLIEYCDRYIDLAISYKNVELLAEKRITKFCPPYLISENEIKKLRITSFNIMRVSDSGVQFLINICEPDTDLCYPFELLVKQNGETIFKEITEY